ncbi:hypothetical protein CHELA20_53351 [Hyphomicrobiales bacterium]|nr:hypothetical protein CHELA20_53351 [Hyphomicrobiales bacterium]
MERRILRFVLAEYDPLGGAAQALPCPPPPPSMTEETAAIGSNPLLDGHDGNAACAVAAGTWTAPRVAA